MGLLASFFSSSTDYNHVRGQSIEPYILAECITLWGEPERVHAYAACIMHFECNSASGYRNCSTRTVWTVHDEHSRSVFFRYAVAPMNVAIEEQVYESVTSTQPRVANGELVAS